MPLAGYDLCTGLGTPNGTNLINALAPPPATPYFTSQPSSLTVTNGANVTFSATGGGQTPLNYQWLFNGANLLIGRQHFRHPNQPPLHHRGDDQQRRQLQPRRHQQLRFRDQQRRRPGRRLRAGFFRAARQPGYFSRKPGGVRRDGRRLGAAGLSMEEERNQPRERSRRFRRHEQRPDPCRRHHQQQRQLQFERDEWLRRGHQQRRHADGDPAGPGHHPGFLLQSIRLQERRGVYGGPHADERHRHDPISDQWRGL